MTKQKASTTEHLTHIAADPTDDAVEEVEYRQWLVSRALELMRSEFSPSVWRACWEHVVSGRSASEVGQELGMTEGAVYAAKCRVLKRLRQDLDGLLE